MDEIAKTEARNYLSAAGFLLIFADRLLNTILPLTTSAESQSTGIMDIVAGIGIIVIAVLLIILRKRDMIAIL